MPSRLEAIPSRLEATASRLDVIASRLEAIPSRLEAIASRLEAIASRLAIAGWKLSLPCFLPQASQLGIASEFIKDVLAQRRITSSVAPPFHTFNEQEWARPSTLRLSPSYYNTEDEVYTVANAIREIVQNGAFEWSAAALLSDPFVFGATRKRPLTVTLFRSKVQQEAI